MRREPWVVLTLLTLSAGWRLDGTAVVADATPPALGPAGATWSTDLDGWGNASPVRFADMVCTTVEPTDVVCLDAVSGAVRFRTTVSRLDVRRDAAIEAELNGAAGIEDDIADLLAQLSKLRRRARSGEDVGAEVAKVSARLDVLKGREAALRTYRTPPVLETIGWASPTPCVAGDTLVASFGNGVVAAIGADGTRRWTRWVGEPVEPMTGYDRGSSASPICTDDLVVVPHHRLTVLSADDGDRVWSGKTPWTHYGPPALGRVAGRRVVVTPAGEVLDLETGTATAMLDQSISPYIGPVVDGDRVVSVFASAEGGPRRSPSVQARRIQATGHASLWGPTTLAGEGRVYTTPVLHGGRLFVLTTDNVLHVLDAADGHPVGTHDLAAAAPEISTNLPMGNLVVAGDRLVATWEIGLIVTVPVDAPASAPTVHRWPEGTRSTPWFEGSTAYVRTLTTLTRLDRR